MEAYRNIDAQLHSIWEQYQIAVENTPRTAPLFLTFFPKGFACTTLSSVDPSYYDRLMVAKTLLGSLVTLYDDFVDHPDLYNPTLFEQLCHAPFNLEALQFSEIGRSHQPVFNFVLAAWEEIFEILASLPHFETLKNLLQFDIEQILNGIKYDLLLVNHPHLAHQAESIIYQNQTMIMVAIGTMDLMGSTGFRVEELGLIRSLLAMRQRMGRISNDLATLSRELAEQDATNGIVGIGLAENLITLTDLTMLEIPLLMDKLKPASEMLRNEWEGLQNEIRKKGQNLQTFDLEPFLAGASSLDELYRGMMGKI